MAMTREGAQKIAAKKVGMSLEEYKDKIKSGYLWCTGCKCWHYKNEFNNDKSRSSGKAQSCRDYLKFEYKKKYVPKPRVSKKGCRFVNPRDGDKKQARRRVNHLVEIGILPHPNILKCSNCNNEKKSKRNEYHHHNGYGAEHQEDVIVLCSACHPLKG